MGVIEKMVSDRYQAFFTQSTVGMGCIDLSERILEVNPAFCRLIGYSSVELIGARFHHFIHPRDVEAYHTTYERLLTQQMYSVYLEQRLLKRSGQSHWVLARFTRLQNDAGDTFCIAVTFEDIQQRRQLETNLRRKAQRDRLLAKFSEQMLRSRDLNQILQSSVESVRSYLRTDRVIVYQFDEDLEQPQPQDAPPTITGTVIVESVEHNWQPMLHHRIADPCFHIKSCLRPYREGKVSAISNIHTCGYARCYTEMLSRYQVISNLIIPILEDGKLWGLLAVQQCRAERIWQLDEIELVQQIATQMAIAIKQSELYTQIQQEAFRQQAINDLSRAILSVQNLEAFFGLALHKFLDIFQAEQVVIGQYRPTNDCWLIIAEENAMEEHKTLLGKELNISPEYLWPDELPGTPVITTALGSPNLPAALADSQLFSVPWVISPLITKSGLWGGLMIAKPAKDPSYWDGSKLDLVELMSRQLALGIQQNLFYKQWKSQAEQQTGLHRLVNAIRESLDLVEIFYRAAQEVIGLLQVERVLIWEFDPNGQVWILREDQYSGEDVSSFIGLEVPDEHNELTHALKRGETLRYCQSQLPLAELIQVLAKTFPGAWLMVPLRLSQMTWGMLHCIQKDDWQDWQQEVASAVADKLAIAVQQSLLYEQVQAANHKLQELALIDSLTQIPNRRYFDDYLQQEWRRMMRESGSISLILCDVDFFKRYNDTYGHQKGDEALKAIAAALKSAVQRPGDVVARYGGEEFGIILPTTTNVGAARIAESIQQTVQQLAIPHQTSEVSRVITLSLGIASTYPQRSITPRQVLELADDALYQAKRQGRNQFCIHFNDPQQSP